MFLFLNEEISLMFWLELPYLKWHHFTLNYLLCMIHYAHKYSLSDSYYKKPHRINLQSILHTYMCCGYLLGLLYIKHY
jgi:hypothetical protein